MLAVNAVMHLLYTGRTGWAVDNAAVITRVMHPKPGACPKVNAPQAKYFGTLAT